MRLIVPTPFAGPAPLPRVHNPTPMQLAFGVAADMQRRHDNGDYNFAADQQSIDMIDHLVGRFADSATGYRMVWPDTLVAITGCDARRS